MGRKPPGWLARAVGSFGRSVREQGGRGTGAPEEALRTPLLALVQEIGVRHGLQVAPVGAAGLPELRVWPDHAVQVDGAVQVDTAR